MIVCEVQVVCLLSQVEGHFICRHSFYLYRDKYKLILLWIWIRLYKIVTICHLIFLFFFDGLSCKMRVLVNEGGTLVVVIFTKRIN